MKAREKVHRDDLILLSTRALHAEQIATANKRLAGSYVNHRNTRRLLNLLERATSLTRHSAKFEAAMFQLNKASERLLERKISAARKSRSSNLT